MSAPLARRRARAEGAFTLVELLIAIVILTVVMGAAVSLLRSQSASFRRGSSRMELNQNMRYAVGTLHRTVRTLGSGVGMYQPMLVYGGTNVLVFNANYASDGTDGTDNNAIYNNPDLPAAAAMSMLKTAKLTIYGTAIQYPDSNYRWGGTTPSRAETIMYYFEPDTETADPNDFKLMQQVNTLAPELLARNIRAYPNRPFFEYWADRLNGAGTLVSAQLSAADVPVRHTAARHGSATDINASALADSVSVIRVNIVTTNGATNADFTSRPISVKIEIPNNGLVDLKSCGDRPLLSGALAAVPNVPADPPAVTLGWPASPDEQTGEQDVSQYNLYYRLASETEWRIFTSVPGSSLNAYALTHGEGLEPGQQYNFAVGAQDCTPRESSLLVSGQITIP
jgi:prepilin-type N-terminal cleavage/methylation domain-containing protein